MLGRGRATQYMGLLHQEYTLYPHRTVRENLTTIGLELPDEFANSRRTACLLLRFEGVQRDTVQSIR
jgi:methyl coenzyme M reductase system subunit A2